MDNKKEEKIIDYDHIYDEDNLIASIIKYVAWFELVIGIIIGFIAGKGSTDAFSMENSFKCWMLYGGIFLGIYALGEIIQILHDIRRTLMKKNK